jgi:DNA-binding MarR family transcriptional regulator
VVRSVQRIGAMEPFLWTGGRRSGREGSTRGPDSLRAAMASRDSEHGAAAARLATAISLLRKRIREDTAAQRGGLTLSQLSLLGRICERGPVTAAALAATEHVTQQAIAQSVAALKARDLVRARPDPADGRKVLLEPTPAGLELRAEMYASRDRWLARATEGEDPEDVARTIGLLERLAEFDR